MYIKPIVIIRAFNQISFLVILVFPFLLYLIPLDWLNKQHTICLFKGIFGIDCYGCGITRAVLSGVQLDFDSAINYNKMVIIVLPLLIYKWLKTAISFYKKTSS
jgi:hypothetical protein